MLSAILLIMATIYLVLYVMIGVCLTNVLSKAKTVFAKVFYSFLLVIWVIASFYAIIWIGML